MAPSLPEDDAAVLAALKDGDEAVFLAAVAAWGPGMLRLARAHLPSEAIAEEVVQEAWVGILRGLDRFEGRSALRTWALGIVANTAKTRGVSEARSVPFSSAAETEEGPVVDPDRFQDHSGRHPGQWALPPAPFPEHRLADAETRDVALSAIAGLPVRQRAVITLRDIEGFSSSEVCNALELSDTNQRVLLHRARSKVRDVLEQHFDAVGGR